MGKSKINTEVMRRLLVSISFLVILCLLARCHHGLEVVSMGIADSYKVGLMQSLVIHPEYSAEEYQWSINGVVVSQERDLLFCSSEVGLFDIKLRMVDENQFSEYKSVVTVYDRVVDPYVSRVYEFCPAPGQFVNLLPQGNCEMDAYKSLLASVKEAFDEREQVISLGGVGGYVTVGFDHSICNLPGEYDIEITGNSFIGTGQKGMVGSFEPGIVEVAIDVNKNGLPDDPWYELAGSEFDNPKTKHNYRITYYRPSENRIVVPSKIHKVIVDSTYILWKDNLGDSGYIPKLSYHEQDYFPCWIEGDSLVFEGTCLPENLVRDLDASGQMLLRAFAWGYVDNAPRDSTFRNSFNIEWAVDQSGQHVHLPYIDFIRIYTGVNQVCGWIGETSTEVSMVKDKHIMGYFE